MEAIDADRISSPDLASLLGLSRPQLVREIQQNGLPVLTAPGHEGESYAFSKQAVLRWAFLRVPCIGRPAGPSAPPQPRGGRRRVAPLASDRFPDLPP